MADYFVVRVKWRDGFVDVGTGTGRRRTIPFDAGEAATEAAAIVIGQAVLDQHGYTPKRSVQAQVNDTPSWPSLGDACATFDTATTTATDRLIARRVTVNDTGFATLQPTLSTRAEVLALRQQRAIRLLTNGTVGGRSSGSNPFQQVNSGVLSGQLSAPSIAAWSWPVVAAEVGPEWEADSHVILTRATATFTDPLSDDVTFNTYINGVLSTFLVVPAGETTYTALGSVLVLAGDRLQVTIDSVGAILEAEGDLVKATFQFSAAPGAFNRSSTV